MTSENTDLTIAMAAEQTASDAEDEYGADTLVAHNEVWIDTADMPDARALYGYADTLATRNGLSIACAWVDATTFSITYEYER